MTLNCGAGPQEKYSCRILLNPPLYSVKSMLIKSADDRESDIKILESLLNHPSASALTKRNIEKEIKAIRSGVKGEKDAAYQIEYY